jgi:hypothetical protein
MPSLEGDLQLQTEIATECPDLIDFSCGDGRLGAIEDEINEIVDDLHSGEFPDAVLRVTRETPAGKLVGITAVELNKGPHIEHELIPLENNQDAAFVVVVALNNEYRGRRTTKQGLRLSEVLVRDVLRYLVEANGGAVPPVQAVIGNGNGPSRELGAQHGFVRVLQGVGASFYVRPRGQLIP